MRIQTLLSFFPFLFSVNTEGILGKVQFSFSFRPLFQQYLPSFQGRKLSSCPCTQPGQCSEGGIYGLPYAVCSISMLASFLDHLSLPPNPERAAGLLWKASNSMRDKLFRKGRTDKKEKYLIHLFAFRLTLSQVECNIHESRTVGCLSTSASPAPGTQAHTKQVSSIRWLNK